MRGVLAGGRDRGGPQRADGLAVLLAGPATPVTASPTSAPRTRRQPRAIATAAARWTTDRGGRRAGRT